jgi:hypothetical protein
MTNQGPLGTSTHCPTIDGGTMCRGDSPVPGPKGKQCVDADTEHLALFSAPSTASSTRAVVYHPGVAHRHTPCNRWAEVQSRTDFRLRSRATWTLLMDPKQVAEAARLEFFVGDSTPLPIANEHFTYYLAGSGEDFDESANIDSWLRHDTGIQSAIARRIPKSQTRGRFVDWLEVTQDVYKNRDFQFAFGAIDILDFEVNFDAGTVRVWFQDFYEWHPFYPGLYTPLPGDGVRDTNFVHAALVEMKNQGAADYWMKGEATVPLSVIMPHRKRYPFGLSPIVP